VTDEPTSFSYLVLGAALVGALAGSYAARAVVLARNDWPTWRTDTKLLYLLVAPILTFAVDLLQITDRLLWRRPSPVPPRRDGQALKRRSAPAPASQRLPQETS